MIAVIANEDAAKLDKFRQGAKLSFPVLVDEGAELIARYGLTNEKRPELPHPATFVLDAEGHVVFRRVDVNYKERPEVSDLLAAIDGQ